MLESLLLQTGAQESGPLCRITLKTELIQAAAVEAKSLTVVPHDALEPLLNASWILLFQT